MFSFLQGGERKYYGEISSSNEYQYFRSQVPQKKLVVDDDSTRIWTLYDYGPKSIACPLICLPPVSGTADIFFMQVNYLANKGLRVIALEYPTYWSLREFLQGFSRLLDYLRLDKVHIFGASLGGFLAQKFIENSFQCPRVQSLILCNSFSDTSIFNRSDSSVMFWAMPFAVLKRLIMKEDRKRLTKDKNIANAIEFMKERLDSLSQQELASRLTLNCANSYVEPQRLQSIPMTIIDVFDHCGISPKACEEMHKLYPQAKKAHLKSGGNFPYLSRPDEVNLHILVHLRQFEGTKYSAYKTLSNSNISS